MYQELVDKKAKLAVIGLGYVGLPIALRICKRYISYRIRYQRKTY